MDGEGGRHTTGIPQYTFQNELNARAQGAVGGHLSPATYKSKSCTNGSSAAPQNGNVFL